MDYAPSRDAEPLIGLQGSSPVSLVAVLVGRRAVAIAADSILVEIDRDGQAQMQDRHQKVARVGNRLGAIAGVAHHDGNDFAAALRLALDLGADVDDVLRLFVSENADPLQRAYIDWRALVGPAASVEQFMQVVVGASMPGRDPEVFECTLVSEGSQVRWDAKRLVPDGVYAYCGLYGSFDAEADRYSSAYRMRHLAASFERRHLPHPYTAGAKSNRAVLEEWARGVVEGILVREAGIERPSWWPEGLPILAGPVQSYAI